MAKRKRLSPAAVMGQPGPSAPAGGLETKAFSGGWHEHSRPPVADVSRDAAQQAALAEVTEELRSAREGGRMVVELPLDQVDEAHLVRDRVEMDADEMTVLTDSLRERGQQTPIEVVQLAPGRYGLISGWRRLTALRELARTEPRFDTVQALIRTPESASDAYRAMVEENEIRANLSFYERARIAVQAARQGIHSSPYEAVQSLFSAARASKRSKIVAFTSLVDVLDERLKFPSAIPEKLGLALSTALQEQKGFRRALSEALRKSSAGSATEERAILERVLKGQPEDAPTLPPKDKPGVRRKPVSVQVAPGVKLAMSEGRVAISGKAVDETLMEDLRSWLASRCATD